MLKTLLFVVIATVQCLEVKDKLNDDHMVRSHLPGQQGRRGADAVLPRSDWSYYYPSWSLPSSISHLFKDEDYVDESPTLLERLAAVEKKLKEMNDLLKKEITGSKKPGSTAAPSATHPNKVEAPAPCKESLPTTMPEKVAKKSPQQHESKPTTDEDKPEVMKKPVVTEPENETGDSEVSSNPKKPTSTNADNPEEPVKPIEIMKNGHSQQESSPVANDKEVAPSK